MNKAVYISTHRITPNVRPSAICTAGPIASNLELTSIASDVNPGRACVIGAFTEDVGMLIIIFSLGADISLKIGRTINWMSNILRIVSFL